MAKFKVGDKVKTKPEGIDPSFKGEITAVCGWKAADGSPAYKVKLLTGPFSGNQEQTYGENGLVAANSLPVSTNAVVRNAVEGVAKNSNPPMLVTRDDLRREGVSDIDTFCDKFPRGSAASIGSGEWAVFIDRASFDNWTHAGRPRPTVKFRDTIFARNAVMAMNVRVSFGNDVKVGDEIGYEGPGRWQGMDGKVTRIISDNRIEVRFKNGEYKVLDTNDCVKNSAVARNAVNANELKTLVNKWVSLVPKCAQMKREIVELSRKLDLFTDYKNAEEIESNPELKSIMKKTSACWKDANWINTGTSDMSFYGF